MAEASASVVYRATEWGLQASQARGRKRAEAVGLVYIALAEKKARRSSSEISPATASVFVSSQRRQALEMIRRRCCKRALKNANIYRHRS